MHPFVREILGRADPRRPPIPRDNEGPPLIGTDVSRLVRRFRENPFKAYVDASRQLGGIFRMPIQNGQWVTVVLEPALVQQVLQKDFREYPKPTNMAGLGNLLGKGLFTSNGDEWLEQRRTLQPLFSKSRIRSFGPMVMGSARDMMDRWAARPDVEEPIDVFQELMAVTLNMAGRSLFGADLGHVAPTIEEAFGFALTFFFEHVATPAERLRKAAMFVPTLLRAKKCKEQLDGIVDDLIAGRRRSVENRDDLLGLLVAATDPESGRQMSERLIRDQVMTMLLAGHETTALSSAYALYLLTRYPEAGRRLERELAEVVGDREPEVNDLSRLEWTTWVFQESMRLYPPAWRFNRVPTVDHELGGYRIPAGSNVHICPWATHRLPWVWDDPEGFDPERFGEAHTRGRHKFAYLPFGAGPRKCIGEGFAMMEGVLLIAAVWQRFTLTLVPGHDVQPVPFVTCRPRDGIRMLVRPRVS